MNFFKKWWKKCQDEEMKRRAESILSDFKVVEKDGVIWLTHLGFAFKEMPYNLNAAEIAKEIQNARQTAIRYEGYKLDATSKSKQQ